mmetsp:Transcript_25337/g.67189  ORF Transcript_25337/g.67189 Transcript_25337/m.67189 type:complete len:186 (+) Transcript_25337:403-960(+)
MVIGHHAGLRALNTNSSPIARKIGTKKLSLPQSLQLKEEQRSIYLLLNLPKAQVQHKGSYRNIHCTPPLVRDLLPRTATSMTMRRVAARQGLILLRAGLMMLAFSKAHWSHSRLSKVHPLRSIPASSSLPRLSDRTYPSLRTYHRARPLVCRPQRTVLTPWLSNAPPATTVARLKRPARGQSSGV